MKTKSMFARFLSVLVGVGVVLGLSPVVKGGVISFEELVIYQPAPWDYYEGEPILGPASFTFSINTGGTLSMTSMVPPTENPTFRGFRRPHTGSRGLICNGVSDPYLHFDVSTIVPSVWVYQEANANQPAWYVYGSLGGVTKWTLHTHAPGETDGIWHEVVSGSAEPIDKITFIGHNLFVDDLTVTAAAAPSTPGTLIYVR